MRFDFLSSRATALPRLCERSSRFRSRTSKRHPQLCLVATESVANRFGAWLADATGVDLSSAPETQVAVGGVITTARHARAALTVAGVRYDAAISICDPWPFAFNLLGQEGLLRFFRVELCAAEGWLEIEPEAAGGSS